MAATDFDLIVLGLGPGGEELAEAMAEAGWSVLGVEPRLTGGECPYFGCIPSKMILRAAGLLAEARRIDGMAGHAEVTPDYTPAANRLRDEATDDWNDQVAVDRFTGKGGTFVRGEGRFLGRDDDGALRVAVGDQEFRSKRVVVATGTAPAVPPVEGLRELRGDGMGDRGEHADSLVWTNREIIRTREAPASMIVMGGGAIGCELGQGFARFGTRVTVVEAGPRLLRPEEPEASAVVAAVFAREGIDVRTGVGIAKVAAGGDGVVVTLADGTELTAEKLLVAAGRKANLPDIGLETIGLDPSARSIPVDEHMQVTPPVEGLYAIGDTTGRALFTHVAVWQARVLEAHLLGQEPEPFGGYHGLAWATFTEPEVGRVGLSEEQARAKGLRLRIGVQQMAANTRGWIHGPGNDGFIKLVEDADRGVLVGATVVAPYGGEILGALTLAVHAEVPTATMATMHYAYPTLHRAIGEAVRALA